MLYSPERSSLAGKAPAGSVLSGITSRIIFSRRIFPAGVRHSGKRHTLYGVKDENGSSMGRGYRSISKLSALLLRALPLLLLCCLAAFGSETAHAQSPKTWNQRGQVAEDHKDYDTAFQDYQHAVNLKPTDLRYKANFARARFLAAAAHVDRGRVLIQSGDLNGALAQFQRALEIDPSYEAAQQEIDQLQKQIAVSQQQIALDNSNIATQNRTVFSEQNPLEKSVAQIQDQINKGQILNPITGTILTKYALEGEMTVTGKAIYKIANLDTLTLLCG